MWRVPCTSPSFNQVELKVLKHKARGQKEAVHLSCASAWQASGSWGVSTPTKGQSVNLSSDSAVVWRTERLKFIRTHWWDKSAHPRRYEGSYSSEERPWGLSIYDSFSGLIIESVSESQCDKINRAIIGLCFGKESEGGLVAEAATSLPAKTHIHPFIHLLCPLQKQGIHPGPRYRCHPHT